MESMAQILQRIQKNLTLQGPYPTGNAHPSYETESQCERCKGMGHLTRGNLIPSDKAFGALLVCPDCDPRPEPMSFLEMLTVREGNKNAIDAAKTIITQGPHASKWLTLYGPVGTGKTSIAEAVLSGWIRRGSTIRTSGELLDYWRSRYSEHDFDECFDAHRRATSFGIDDLGAEKVTAWASEKLFVLLEYRYRYGLKTVITTNLDYKKLVLQFGDARIADRIYDVNSGLVTITRVGGKSFRTGQ